MNINSLYCQLFNLLCIVNQPLWICFQRADQCVAVDEPSTGWVSAVGHLQKEQHDEARWRNQAEVSNVDSTFQIVIPPSLAELNRLSSGYMNCQRRASDDKYIGWLLAAIRWRHCFGLTWIDI